MPSSDKSPSHSSTDVANHDRVERGLVDRLSHSDHGTFADNAALVAVLQASQALSSELQLDQLLVLLLQTMLEHSGADQGAVLMPREQGWYLEATATAKQPAQVQSIALADSTTVPHGLICNVKERLETVVIVDASIDPTLVPETYIQTHQPKSLMCAPLLHQGQLVAVLYLENQTTAGVFTDDRLLVLNFLATQAAISLRNVRLYTQAQEDQRRLAALMSNLPGMAYVAANDEHWTMHFASEGCFELTGYTSDELINNRVTDFGTLIHADDAEAVGLEVETAIAANRPYRVVYRIRTKQGGEKWLWEQGQAILDDNGNPTLLEGLIIDINDRKAAEIALGEREAHYRALVSAIPDLIMRANRNGIHLDWAASSQTKVLGDISEFEGKHVTELAPSEPAQQRLQAIQRALESQSTEVYEQTLIIEGEKQQEEVRVVPYAEDEVLLLVRDISDRKAAEQALQQSQLELTYQKQSLRSILDIAPIWIWMTNTQGKILFVNQTFCSDVAVSESQFLAAAHYRDVLGGAADNCIKSDQACLAQNSTVHAIEVLQLADGQEHILETIKTPVTDKQGQVIGLVGLGIDMTQQRQMEATIQENNRSLSQALQDLQQAQLQMVQSEKMSALGSLVAGVAHEINNPVGCILGNVGATQTYISDLLGLLDLYAEQFPEPGPNIEDELDAVDLGFVRQDLPQLVRAMKDSGDRIKSISQSLRTFSRADTDEKQAFNLYEGIDSTVLILRHRLKANEQRPEIEVVTDYGDMPEVDCFPGQLNQVFMNILANAIDALDEASQTRTIADLKANPQRITIRTGVKDNWVQIVIADNGPGISNEVQSKIFDHLFTTKTVGKGTGLGLAIARQIIEDNHGGSLEMTSELGKGTEFYIRLPK